MSIYAKSTDYEFRKRFTWLLMKIRWTDYDDFVSKYGEPWSEEADIEVWASIRDVGNFLEGVGVLVKRRLIDPALVDDLLSGLIILMWEKFGPLILEVRKRHKYPQFLEWFEYLYNEIKTIAVEQHPELKT